MSLAEIASKFGQTRQAIDMRRRRVLEKIKGRF